MGELAWVISGQGVAEKGLVGCEAGGEPVDDIGYLKGDRG